jgi:hypothetical protein
MIPQGEVMGNRRVRAWVPMDDEHLIWFIMSARSRENLNLNATSGTRTLPGSMSHQMHPNSTDWYGRFRPVPDAANDYQLDRDSWRRGETWAGLPSVTIEDHMVTETMGTIYNRPEEHLGSSDAMIIRTRQRLLRAAEALASEGLVPPGVDEPHVYHQRSGGLLLPKDADWFEATVDARRAFVDHAREEILASVKP